MTDHDRHVREAVGAAVLKERIELRLAFAPPVAAALEVYFRDVLTCGLVKRSTRQALAELLADYGLADPDGRAALTTQTRASDAEVSAAYALYDLARFMSVTEFRHDYNRARRESVRPLTAREFADDIARTRPSQRFSGPLSDGWARVRSLGRGLPWRR